MTRILYCPANELQETREKFRELLLEEQETLLRHREFARKIMAGEIEEE